MFQLTKIARADIAVGSTRGWFDWTGFFAFDPLHTGHLTHLALQNTHQSGPSNPRPKPGNLCSGQGVFSRQEDAENTEWAVLLEDLVSRHLESGPKWRHKSQGSQLLPQNTNPFVQDSFNSILNDKFAMNFAIFMNLSKNWAGYGGIIVFFSMWMSCIFSV